MEVEFGKFVEWGFMAVLTGGVAFSTKFLGKISKSVSDLNTQIAVILERMNWHQREIESHGSRISKLENTNQGEKNE